MLKSPLALADPHGSAISALALWGANMLIPCTQVVKQSHLDLENTEQNREWAKEVGWELKKV